MHAVRPRHLRLSPGLHRLHPVPGRIVLCQFVAAPGRVRPEVHLPGRKYRPVKLLGRLLLPYTGPESHVRSGLVLSPRFHGTDPVRPGLVLSKRNASDPVPNRCELSAECHCANHVPSGPILPVWQCRVCPLPPRCVLHKQLGENDVSGE